MNLPNLLTMLRIFSIPVLVVVLLSQFEGKELAAVIIFLLAALTDTLDGLLARKRGQVTILGQILDPIADKLLIASAFICLVELGAVSAWMVVIILGRELAVTGFRAIASSKGIHIASSRLGKFKMISEAITICLLILGEEYLGRFNFISQIGLWVVIAIATISAAEYYIRFGPRVISKHS
ncbi:MAG: CDP-diacylglycerol--glycerol-3-phosphate 3-phosphatidyltransferase [Candidatus Aminicenantes bacterium]|nr:MAG: CDP-diacylglycerol--glycerol-3-phosphate 3-phosphatidyltransferase [Candidatus Aminicenantes bacterium]